MNTVALACPEPDPIPHLHAGFLLIVPKIERHGRVYFRHVRSPFKKEELIAEMVALCWKWYVRLVLRGKDPSRFPSALACFAARAVNSGRRLCGQEPAKDVLSGLAQQRHDFVVSTLPEFSTYSSNPLEEALQDNTLTPVDEQVCFRLDFPAWLRTLSDRDRRVVGDLMWGERTLDVARKHGMSPGRVSQLRRQLLLGWRSFCGEERQDGAAASV